MRINWQLADKIKATMYHQDFIYQYQILVKGRGWGASEAHLGTRDNPKHVGFHGHEVRGEPTVAQRRQSNNP